MLTPRERQHCLLLLKSCCTLPDSAADFLHAALRPDWQRNCMSSSWQL